MFALCIDSILIQLGLRDGTFLDLPTRGNAFISFVLAHRGEIMVVLIVANSFES